MPDSPLYRRRQRNTVLRIYTKTQEKGFAPTQKELARSLRVSEGAIRFRLDRAKREGHITWVPNHPRTLQVLDRFWQDFPELVDEFKVTTT